MKVAVFSTKPYDRRSLAEANGRHGHDLTFLEVRLDGTTSPLAQGFEGVCAFVNDCLDAQVLQRLAEGGTQAVALRSAGFNNVDLSAAARVGVTVMRVPAYSPHAVAEHTIALMLALNRKLHRAYIRGREGDFSLEGLLGFDVAGKTAGVVGTGRIGAIVARLLLAFGCQVLAYDPFADPGCEAAGVRYVSLEELLSSSHIITLHCPLTPESYHLIDAGAIATMRSGVMLINTGRGALVDTRAVVAGLKSGRIGHLGIDVYEEEAGLFFENLSGQVIQDDVFTRLLTFPNVLVTGHQGFFTREALENIAETTLGNLSAFAAGRASGNEVVAMD